MRSLLRSIVLPGAALILVLSAVPAFSQGCALCYTQALGSVGMIFVMYKKRDQVRHSDEDGDTFRD